jgi:hypothetical protein
VLGQRAQEHHLRARQPDRRAQRLRVLVEQLLGQRRPVVEQGGQPAVDRPRRRDAQLLADYRTDERAVVVVRGRPRRIAAKRGRADLVDQARQDGVGAAQVRDGVSGAQGWPSTPPGTPVFVE